MLFHLPRTKMDGQERLTIQERPKENGGFNQILEVIGETGNIGVTRHS